MVCHLARRDMSSELEEKEREKQELLTSMAALQEENATLWHEAQQGLSLAASLAEMHERLQVVAFPRLMFHLCVRYPILQFVQQSAHFIHKKQVIPGKVVLSLIAVSPATTTSKSIAIQISLPYGPEYKRQKG